MILCVCPNPAIDRFWWLDGLEMKGTNRIRKEARFPGGKGIHVAMAIAEMGEEANLLGIWAGDHGRWIKEECGKHGVTCFGMDLPEGNNRSCITLRSTYAPIDQTEFLGQGPLIRAADYQLFLREYEGLIGKAEVVVLSGSWPAGAPQDAYGPMIDGAKERGIKVWVDCSGSLLAASLEHHPFGVHVNESEAAAISGREPNKQDRLLPFVQKLALTKGAEGLFFYGHDTALHATCQPERMYSAVGSGDCLVAGLAVSTQKQDSDVRMAGLGVAAGAANCVREELGMLYREDVEKLFQQVKIKPINNYHPKTSNV